MSFHDLIAHFVTKYYSIMWVYHRLFMHSPFEGHLGCFLILEMRIEHSNAGFCVVIIFNSLGSMIAGW